MKIHQKDLGDILNVLPDAITLNKDCESDLIICTLGFEERTHAVIDELLSLNPKKHKKILLVKYQTNKEDNEINHAFFLTAKDKGLEIIEIEYSRNNFYNNFSDLLTKLNINNSNVIFDISTCSSYLFYPIIKSLIDYDIKLTIAYADADIYFPTLEEWKKVEEKAINENQLFVKSWDDADFQSIGVDDIYNSNLFSEMNPGNKPSILFAIPNFNSIRMQSIKEKDLELNKTESKNIKWLIGMPPKTENKWRAEAILKTNTLEGIDTNNLEYISTLDYKEIIKTLESHWMTNKYSYHISIGSLGSKMQHLGIFFFVLLHQDVGLWLAEPVEFKAKTYSKGVCNLYEIDFGFTKYIREKLSTYRQYVWET